MFAQPSPTACFGPDPAWCIELWHRNSSQLQSHWWQGHGQNHVEDSQAGEMTKRRYCTSMSGPTPNLALHDHPRRGVHTVPVAIFVLFTQLRVVVQASLAKHFGPSSCHT